MLTQALDGAHKRLARHGTRLDAGSLDDVGTQLAQAPRKRSQAIGRPRHGHGEAAQRKLVIPVEGLGERTDLAHHEDGRTRDAGVAGGVGNGGKGGVDAALARRRAALDHGRRRRGVHARGEQAAGDLGRGRDGHHEHERAANARERVKVHAKLAVLAPVPRHEVDRGGAGSVGCRDARV